MRTLENPAKSQFSGEKGTSPHLEQNGAKAVDVADDEEGLKLWNWGMTEAGKKWKQQTGASILYEGDHYHLEFNPPVTKTQPPIIQPPVIKTAEPYRDKSEELTNIPTVVKPKLEESIAKQDSIETQVAITQLPIITNVPIKEQVLDAKGFQAVPENFDTGNSSVLESAIDLAKVWYKDNPNKLEHLEEVKNSIKEGATLSDLYDMFLSSKAKNTSSTASSINIEPSSYNMMEALGAPIDNNITINPNKDLVYKYVEGKTTETLKNLDSKPFILNLKSSPTIKSFKSVTNDSQAKSLGFKSKEDYYSKQPTLSGPVIMSIQNDVQGGGTYPRKKVLEGEDISYANTFALVHKGNKFEVVKSNSLKPGDEFFNLRGKSFSFDDFDIKNGKIKTTWDSNIEKLVPLLKSGSAFTVGLTGKLPKNTKELPISSADQYGRSKGGSMVIFSTDLDQQYVVGGSFNDWYKFYTKLQGQFPKKIFRTFIGDTGSYSGSAYSKSGKLTPQEQRERSNQNTWGNVEHLVLENN